MAFALRNQTIKDLGFFFAGVIVTVFFMSFSYSNSCLLPVSYKGLEKVNSSPKVHDCNLVNSMQLPPFIFPQLYRCRMKIENLPLEAEHASQSREDMWLFENIFSLLPEAELIGGTFIEIGAENGLKYSNTLYYEKKWDWRGILVEGHPKNQRALRANYNARINSAIFTSAICDYTQNGDVGFLNFTTRGGPVGAATDYANFEFLDFFHAGERAGTE